MVNVIETFDAKETFALGEKIGKEVQPGDIFCLADAGTGCLQNAEHAAIRHHCFATFVVQHDSITETV